MARYLSYAKTDWYYRPAQLPRAADAEKLARAAIDAGCDDPLVLDMYAVVLNDTHHWSDEAQKLATKAVDGLVAGKYPDYRAMNSARRMLRHLDPDKQHDEFVKYSTLERELAAKSVKSMSINGRFDRRGVWSFVDDDLDSMKAAELKTYYEDVHRGGGDPWLVNLLGGYYHVAAAWEARGGGWANTVGEDGWKTFFSELAEAHKCLAAAHDLEPKFPEAATKMISVAMGEQQNGPGDSPRSWFDRAIAAQLDYHPAYSAYLWALRPRWIGSLQEMYELGLECADTNRYDTRVPMELVTALRDIRSDEGGWEFWRQPGVLDNAADVLAHYADRAAEQRVFPIDWNFFNSQIVGFAWQVGRYDKAREALDRIDGKYDPNAFNYTGTIISSRTVSGVYAFTSELATPLKAAEADAAMLRFEAAIQSYKEAAAKVEPNDNASLWVRGRAAELTWQSTMNRGGDWIDMVPQKDLAGWYPVSGKWSSDGRAITAEPDAQGAVLMCGAKFGERYQFRGKIKLVKPAHANAADPQPPDDPSATPSSAGPVYRWGGGTDYFALWIRPESGSREFYAADKKSYPEHRGHVNPIGADNEFIVDAFDGSTGVHINGQQAVRFGPAWTAGSRPDDRIGIAVSNLGPGVKFEFSNLQIRRLDDPPKQ
jgi:tetratricopeptide (TPR) repeat protein